MSFWQSFLAASICTTLAQPCWADETLFTCKGGSGHLYTAEGGYEKPGWQASQIKSNVIKLIKITKAAEKGSFYDIQGNTEHGKFSALENSCKVYDHFYLNQDQDITLDQAFVVACKGMISTYLFYTRSGAAQLIETHLVLLHDHTGASVSATKDCKQGD
jgi:hypothetical protein